MIPRVVHQTWRDDAVPARWSGFAESWRRHHPGWAYRLWSDADGRALIARRLPELVDLFDALPYGIQRADVIRYAVLWCHGGVYADLDLECLRPVDALVTGRRLVLTVEPAEQARAHGREHLLSNAWMASVAGHPLLRALLDEVRAGAASAVTHVDVLETTGPRMVQRVCDRRGLDDAVVVGAEAFHHLPAGSRGLALVAAGGPSAEKIRARLVARGAYGIHHWSNSWVGTLAGVLHSPEPDGVAGFEFVPGIDSPGGDVANGGRDVPRLAAAARARDDVVAFNTDGFMKTTLLPPEDCARLGRPGSAEGLYLRLDRVPEAMRAAYRARIPPPDPAEEM
ncbi:MAG: hypothetical protein H6982_09665 [Chromatiales bacterium]|nr:hypothetical protein [Chromatiales bacterium]